MSKLLVFLLLIICLPAFSQQKNFRSEFGFRSDNDAYLAIAQDQYYTNGLFITYRHALRARNTALKTIKKTYELEAGQSMYNATSGVTERLRDVDRPFTAYLYGGAKFNWFREDERVLQVSLEYGTIGPKALGREVQETLHNTIGFYNIEGWEYQLYNQSGLNSSAKFMSLIGRGNERNDFTLQTYVNAGTTRSNAGIGVLYRSGSFNKLFESVSTNSRISNSIRDSVPAKEFFFFARPVLQLTVYDATIQGGLFRENKGPVSFSPNRLLFSQELGVMYANNRWTLDFSVIFQTKEIKTQEEAHQYGSIGIYYRF